jgi:hypothetical protein
MWATGAFALATGGAIAAVTVLGGTADAASSAGSPVIRSGAGPGWPKTLRPSDFVRHVTNPWFPLKPGSKYRYRGVKEGTHMVDVLRPTHRTKTIEGVKTTVVHDVVYIHGKPREVTNDYYAQDRHRNVWYFGEDTKELTASGHVISRNGSFRSGRNGAEPGVLFPGHPRRGVKGRQEFYKGHAEDHFKVLDRHARVSVPFVTTHHAVRTKEWTPLEPKTLDNKYYVHGIGTVREIAVKGPVERLHLVSFKR